MLLILLLTLYACKISHAICTDTDPSFEAKPPKDFTQNMQRKDYRVRIMRDRYRIQLMMHRCCVDNIVSKKYGISRLRFLSKVILNDVEFNHEH